MRNYLVALMGALLVCLLVAIGSASGSPETVTVNSTTDVSNGDTSSITRLKAEPGPDGVISLREAIVAANNASGSDTIGFAIPAKDPGYEVSGITGTWTISLTGQLPPITDTGTLILGGTQAEYIGSDVNPEGPEIEIAGESSWPCFEIESAENRIQGLVINRCGQQGAVYIHGSGAHDNVVDGNYIGTDAVGGSPLGNTYGVNVSNGAHSNVIGGGTAVARNLISGNDYEGVTIHESGTTTNTVAGNYIGINASGDLALGNGAGVYIWRGAQGNTIGGDTEGERNVISGNAHHGVEIAETGTDGNSVCGNYIGTDASGLADVGNLGIGVHIWGAAQNNVLGGSLAVEGNVVSGNERDGVRISGAHSNTVSANLIGTDALGTSDLGNDWNGVYIQDGALGNVVGGDGAGARNTISGNGSNGVCIYNGSNGNTVLGNYIGTDATGSVDLGNDCSGVDIVQAQDNVIGGAAAGEGNVISGNGLQGVHLHLSGTVSNTVSGNYIGTSASGATALGNTWDGVAIEDAAQGNTIGGSTPGERNIISGNAMAGVRIRHAGSNDNTVSGNYIGTNAAGSAALANTYQGVTIDAGAKNNVIGGESSDERNVISGNGTYGVWILHSGTDANIVQGNYIGRDAAGTGDLHNGESGVSVSNGAKDNVIGPDNLIAHSLTAGVEVHGGDTTGNTITRNSIHSNVGLGIYLLSGGNGGIPSPVVLAANACFVAGTAAAGDTIEVFTGPDEEGKTYLATTSTGIGGYWGVSGPFLYDSYVTATATDGNGNTSQFSAQASAGSCSRIFVPLAMKNF